jgi:hypothetical protein
MGYYGIRTFLLILPGHHNILGYIMCEFNYTHEIRLNIAHAELKPRREGDQSIMAAVYHYFNSAAALRAINRVRMLHGVVNVSDITAADGRALNQFFW